MGTCSNAACTHGVKKTDWWWMLGWLMFAAVLSVTIIWMLWAITVLGGRLTVWPF